jgi:putative PIN family toxin of toxin-antitoxin system
MRVVIDANCLIQIIPTSSKYRWIWDYYLRGKYELCVSTDILVEIEEVYGRWTPKKIVNNILQVILNRDNTIFVNPSFFWRLINEDKDDNKYVDCAIACNADMIISNDTHFKILESIDFPRLSVYTVFEVRKNFFKQ